MILQHPSESLRAVCEPVENLEEARAVITRLWREFADAPIPAAGLAAPQIGVPLRIIVVLISGERCSMINPLISQASQETSGAYERCLSIEEGRREVFVERPSYVLVHALDKQGRRIGVYAKDADARVLQHEIDHLDGVLILDQDRVD